MSIAKLQHHEILYRNGDDEVVVGRQVLLRLHGYISVCPILQLSHNDVPGVGLGGCWNQVVPSHSLANSTYLNLVMRIQESKSHVPAGL